MPHLESMNPNICIARENVRNPLRPCLVAYCKVFETAYLYICNIKHRLITKLITELVYKLRDESNEHN